MSDKAISASQGAAVASAAVAGATPVAAAPTELRPDATVMGDSASSEAIGRLK